ncbi:flagellar filament capping protein FliD [Massilia sp. GCM10023247]|uniref:flagellar filament capping protein FliD n=1 Tax=Massilia sp. GCM10023247 TaxID=3252643 RepID=UPI003610BC18
MGLSSAGIGSNLPIDSIISQLMAVERRPIDLLDKRVASFQSQLSAIGSLKSAMASFQSAAAGLSDIGKFQAISAKIADSAVASASAGPKATPGKYSLEVSQLAQSQKLVTSGQASATAALGQGTSSSTITIDLGTIALGTGGSFDAASGKYAGASFTPNGSGAKTITIDPANTSLSGIRDAINKADAGVTASIVNDGGASPYRLVLTQTASGQANSMKISVAGDPALQALLGHDPQGAQALSESVTAKNAEFKLDGIAISTATNTPSDVLDGVTLTLAKTNVGSPTTLDLARDTDTVSASVAKFVSAFNDISKKLTDLTAYNETTKTAAVLNSDSTVRSIRNELRAMLGSPVSNSGAFSVLSEIGVTLKGGVMTLDDAKLKKAAATNFDDIAGLFASVGKPTDSQVSFKSAGAKTVPGNYAIEVSQAAARGALTGANATPLTIGDGNNTLDITLDGVRASVTLANGTYASFDALVAELQTKINGTPAFSGAGSSVSVSHTNGTLSITSNRWGAGSNVSIAADAAGTSLLGGAGTAVAGKDIIGTIGGVPAVGSGRTLTGAAGSPSEGMALIIEGSGSRGSVSYSQGYAAQFDQFARKLLDAEGALALRSDGINASIKTVSSNRDRIEQRLVETEKRLRRQYTALDSMISSMNSTSAYLSQQLAALANLR